MENLNIQFHATLNPDLWEGDSLKPDVKDALLKISEEFVNFLKVEVEPEDIIMLGSSANYNYTEYSDIDLHMIVDFSKVGEEKTIVKELFDAKKFIWNNEHDIKIYGHEIECYVQDVGETNASTAVYSLTTDEWLKKPSADHPKIDTQEVLVKAKDFAKRIELAKGDSEALNSLKDKLKDMRKSGLKKAGEYSTENLVFKALRNSKHIEKLMNYAKNIFDKELSLDEFTNEWKELS